MRKILSTPSINPCDVWPIIAPYGQCLWFAKLPTRETLGGPLASWPALSRTIERINSRGGDTYVALNPARPNGIKASSQQVYEFRHILLDLDPFDGTLDPQKAFDELDLGILDIPKETIWRASTVLDSGRGTQIWLAVNPLPLGATTRAVIENSLRGFLSALARRNEQRGWRIDTSTSDLPRVARCPGSVNSKTGRLTRVVRIAEGALSFDLFKPFELPSYGEARKVYKNLTNLSTVLPHLNRRAREFLTEGVGTPGRHAAAYATGAALKQAGCEEAQSIQWAVGGGSLCQPPLDEAECARAVRSAYRRQDGAGH
jgi:hypothetical protein